MPSWDPEVYARYKSYRDRPALDLLLQIPEDLHPKTIWDLGCGAGEQAALLAARHPQARVSGLDSSPQMLTAARARSSRVTWVLGDVTQWSPPSPPDLIFSNSVLQWTTDHATLFPKLAASLAPDGVLACQMSQSFDQVWHVALRALAAEPAWRDRLQGLRDVRPVAAASAYFDWLSGICGEIDIWSTTYLHVLEGEDPVVEWLSGSGLRPYLDALPDAREQERFLQAFRDRLAVVLPPRADGVTLFPMPRLFIIARR